MANEHFLWEGTGGCSRKCLDLSPSRGAELSDMEEAVYYKERVSLLERLIQNYTSIPK